MRKRVSVAEAKNKLPSIVREVEGGSVVEITKRRQSGSDSTTRKGLQTNGGERTRVLGKP